MVGVRQQTGEEKRQSTRLSLTKLLAAKEVVRRDESWFVADD